ncbi:MAG: DegV family protein, partial [Oscillospiraceae bacterium]|nr:DegV family protein [Oscillospiraceae bacterium]
MREYVIYTDSACDISQELLQEWGVRVLQLSVQFKGENESFLDYEMPSKLFYQKMRDGQVAVTSAVNADTFQKAFAATLDEGLDVLYLAFSSGLSATYNSACIAVEELRAAYPERRIQAVDTLAASAGFGLLVYL